MDQLDLPEIPSQKIFSEKAVRVGTFLGGPLIAGYLLAENFKVFDQNEKAKNTWIISIISTIIVFAGPFVIPGSDKIPNQVIPIAYTILVSYLVHKYQGTQIEFHVKSGGQTFGWWRVIVISIIGLIITVLSILFYFTVWESV
jgi:uncharacterized membrane protein HdeD (DUF308 family)